MGPFVGAGGRVGGFVYWVFTEFLSLSLSTFSYRPHPSLGPSLHPSHSIVFTSSFHQTPHHPHPLYLVVGLICSGSYLVVELEKKNTSEKERTAKVEE